MTATKKLRTLLDECGINRLPSAWDDEHETFLEVSGDGFLANKIGNRLVTRIEGHPTPEQLVEATLDRGD